MIQECIEKKYISRVHTHVHVAENCLQMASMEQRGYEGTLFCKRIAENNNIIAGL